MLVGILGVGLIGVGFANIYAAIARAQKVRNLVKTGNRTVGRVAGLRHRNMESKTSGLWLVANFTDERGNQRAAFSRLRNSQSDVEELRGRDISIVYNPLNFTSAYWLDEVTEPE